MPSLTRLLNKTVVNDNNAELGVVQGVALDKTSGKCMLCLDTGIYITDSVTAKKNTLIASNAQISQLDGEQLVCKDVYTADGKRVGTVIDVYFNTAMTLNKVLCNNGQMFTRRQLQGVGDVIIARLPKPSAQQKAKTDKKHNKTTSIGTKPVDTATADTATADATFLNATPIETMQTVVVKQDVKNQAEQKYPKRRYGDFSFLIGKTADKNITNFYGEVMIRVGDKVTVAILRQAKLAGKLIELCLHSK